MGRQPGGGEGSARAGHCLHELLSKGLAVDSKALQLSGEVITVLGLVVEGHQLGM